MEINNTIFTGLTELRQQNLFCDLFILGEEDASNPLPAHTCIIAAYSSVLRTLLYSDEGAQDIRKRDSLVIKVNGISRLMWRYLLDYMYNGYWTSEDSISLDFYTKLLAACTALDLTCLRNTLQMSADNYFLYPLGSEPIHIMVLFQGLSSLSGREEPVRVDPNDLLAIDICVENNPNHFLKEEQICNSHQESQPGTHLEENVYTTGEVIQPEILIGGFSTGDIYALSEEIEDIITKETSKQLVECLDCLDKENGASAMQPQHTSDATIVDASHMETGSFMLYSDSNLTVDISPVPCAMKIDDEVQDISMIPLIGPSRPALTDSKPTCTRDGSSLLLHGASIDYSTDMTNTTVLPSAEFYVCTKTVDTEVLLNAREWADVKEEQTSCTKSIDTDALNAVGRADMKQEQASEELLIGEEMCSVTENCKPVTCFYCKSVMYNKVDLIDHIYQECRTLVDNWKNTRSEEDCRLDGEYRCINPGCRKLFSTVKLHIAHEKKCLTKFIPPNAVDYLSKDDQGRFVLDGLHFLIMEKNSIRRPHCFPLVTENVTSDPKSVYYRCGHCEHENSIFGIATHLMVKHLQAHPFECNKCPKPFKFWADLRNHYKEKHSIQKMTCRCCDILFHDYEVYRQHIKMVAKANLSCPICSKVLSKTSRFNCHLNTHVPYEYRKFECDVCCKRFVQTSDLRKHKKIHQIERSYRCRHCCYTTHQQGNLRKHLKAVHGMLIGNFLCITCRQSFLNKWQLQAHLSTASHDTGAELKASSDNPDEFIPQYYFDASGRNVQEPLLDDEEFRLQWGTNPAYLQECSEQLVDEEQQERPQERRQKQQRKQQRKQQLLQKQQQKQQKLLEKQLQKQQQKKQQKQQQKRQKRKCSASSQNTPTPNKRQCRKEKGVKVGKGKEMSTTLGNTKGNNDDDDDLFLDDQQSANDNSMVLEFTDEQIQALLKPEEQECLLNTFAITDFRNFPQ